MDCGASVSEVLFQKTMNRLQSSRCRHDRPSQSVSTNEDWLQVKRAIIISLIQIQGIPGRIIWTASLSSPKNPSLQKSKRRASFLRANLCRTIRLNKMSLEQHSLRKIVKSNFRVLLPGKFSCLTVTIKSYVEPRMRLEKIPFYSWIKWNVEQNLSVCGWFCPAFLIYNE